MKFHKLLLEVGQFLIQQLEKQFGLKTVIKKGKWLRLRKS